MADNTAIGTDGSLTKSERIYANDIYSKTQVDNLILDPTANTMTACVGYEQDILGGY